MLRDDTSLDETGEVNPATCRGLPGEEAQGHHQDQEHGKCAALVASHSRCSVSPCKSCFSAVCASRRSPLPSHSPQPVPGPSLFIGHIQPWGKFDSFTKYSCCMLLITRVVQL